MMPLRSVGRSRAPAARFAAALSLAGVLVSAAALAAYPGQEISDPVVRECLARTLPERSMTQKLRFSTYDGDGGISDTAADLYWRRFEDGGSKALIRLTAPARKVGLALLAEEQADNTLQQDVTAYLPELRVVRRLSGSALSGSMFGTNFSYADFVELQGMLHHRAVRRLGDTRVHERDAYTIEMVPQQPESQYSRIVTFVDQEWCIAVELRFFGAADELLKELIVDPASISEVSNRRVPHAMVLTDHENAGRTELVIDEIAINPQLNPNLFTPSQLRRGR